MDLCQSKFQTFDTADFTTSQAALANASAKLAHFLFGLVRGNSAATQFNKAHQLGSLLFCYLQVGHKSLEEPGFSEPWNLDSNDA